jgi:prepilin-type N-terminal cleavage/methylation domain-containing protein
LLASGSLRALRARLPSRLDCGFTLFEVLAAILIFGLLYTVLAEVAIRSVFAEGNTGRRLRASLVADRAIVEVEAQLEQGIAPPLGETETDDGEFRVRTSVTPFDASAFDAEPEAAPADAGAAPSAPSLLTPSGPTQAPALLTIAVVVSWTDGLLERSVYRTTYALNFEAAAPLLAAIQPAEVGASETGAQ